MDKKTFDKIDERHKSPAPTDWEEKLFELSEKYCKHDDRKLNSCLYYIFLPFLRSLQEEQKKVQELLKELDNARAREDFMLDEIKQARQAEREAMIELLK